MKPLSMKKCTVIIPVYNAFVVAQQCLSSVLSTLPVWANILVIDDCSPEGDFKASLPAALQTDPRVRYLKNINNIGFVGTCNRGMLLYSVSDVVLLNSDTVVTERWLEKMQCAAYSRTNVGTVTPFTNNGTIASIPRFLENNSFAGQTSIEAFADMVERLSTRAYPELPTCVGFCVYITRALLDAVGGFDPEFGKGYGEENDLSLRGAGLGFANILDDATFIYHHGSMSFKEMKDALSSRNTVKLAARYPNYEHDVAVFCGQNPLHKQHSRIWNVLQKNFVDTRARSILHILHNGPFVARRHALGGTEKHVQAIIERDSSTAHFSLVPVPNGFYLTAHTPFGERVIWLPADTDFSYLFSREFFDIVHLHHTIGFDLSKIAAGLKAHGNYLVSVHDYWLVCDRIFLRTPDGEVCDGLACNNSCEAQPESIQKKREITFELLKSARRCVVFSQSSEVLLSGIFKQQFNSCIRPHGVALPPRIISSAPNKPEIGPENGAGIRVLLMGTVAPHKGVALQQALTSMTTLPSGIPITWAFIGEGGEALNGVSNLGSYTNETLQSMILQYAPHAAVLVPQCQETYSITLDELVWCGVPMVVTPFGALPERVRAWGVGLVSDNSVSGILQGLDALVQDGSKYRQYRQAAVEAPILTIDEEIAEYTSLYQELEDGSRAEGGALMRFLQAELCEKISSPLAADGAIGLQGLST